MLAPPTILSGIAKLHKHGTFCTKNIINKIFRVPVNASKRNSSCCSVLNLQQQEPGEANPGNTMPLPANQAEILEQNFHSHNRPTF